ncbi:hypothetical protein F5Y15DRAFT_426580 [Xylariaceae sp. FL0016]|nr:hypothetical protein F5Y15DRAFT_426580 [Xylariaceae sp. FL0016]
MPTHSISFDSFEISTRDSELSLDHIGSTAFFTTLSASLPNQEDFRQLIQSKQIWLLSPGVCRLEINLNLDLAPIDDPKLEPHFLEYIAQVIANSTLDVLVRDIKYEQMHDGTPNLYFSLEHPEKSSSLLCPPHMPSMHFQGLECQLRLSTELNGAKPEARDQGADCIQTDEASLPASLATSQDPARLDGLYSPFEVLGSNTQDACIPDIWLAAGSLIEAALQTLIGTKKRFPGLKSTGSSHSVSLLELAPTIWNPRYLQLTAAHARYFSKIANILGSCVSGQSPELRRTTKRLRGGIGIQSPEDEDDKNNDNGYSTLRDAAHQKLWGLLQANLKPTVGVANRSAIPQRRISQELDEVVNFNNIDLGEQDSWREHEHGSVAELEHSQVIELDIDYWEEYEQAYSLISDHGSCFGLASSAAEIAPGDFPLPTLDHDFPGGSFPYFPELNPYPPDEPIVMAYHADEYTEEDWLMICEEQSGYLGDAGHPGSDYHDETSQAHSYPTMHTAGPISYRDNNYRPDSLMGDMQDELIFTQI